MKTALVAIETPHIRRRDGGFGGLFRIIVEQQVSVPSAQAIWGRIGAAMDVDDPESVTHHGADGLRAAGLSRPKIKYVLGLAERVSAGDFAFGAISALDNDQASALLQSIKGVGPWTSAIYLLFCDGRADIWPARDVALKASYNQALADHAAGPSKVGQPARRQPGQREDLTQQALDELANEWAPYRGLAAHILWTYYAQLRGRAPI